MQIDVPSLSYDNILPFCRSLSAEHLNEECHFNFKNGNYDPFPMLLLSSVIRRLRSTYKDYEWFGSNCTSSYAQHMGFFTSCGLNIGKKPGEASGNRNYLPIQRLHVEHLQRESQEQMVYIGEVIENKAKEMAGVLARGDQHLGRALSYLLCEMIRNIPEHSEAEEIWICARYWPSYDLVELALLDEGIGIKNSLCKNLNYKKLLANDAEAISLALRPGISESFSLNRRNNSDENYWANSGYGLFMASRICQYLNGSFIIASGDCAVRLYNFLDEKNAETIPTNFQGTAIQMRLKPSEIVNYERVKKEILSEGDAIASKDKKAYRNASRASKGL